MKFALGSLAVAALLAPVGLAQPKTFEVSTVKPNSSGDGRELLRLLPGGGFSSTGTTLKILITEAYWPLRDFQIFGAPGWINTDRWDVQAKAEGVQGQLSIEQFRPMLQALLADRFQLKVHRETREMQVYALSVAKGGLKMQPSSGDPDGRMDFSRGRISGKRVKMAMAVQALSNTLGRPVIDKTGLTGEYDFTVEFTPEPGYGTLVSGTPPVPGPDAPPPPGTDGPTIFTAIQEQLGLRLDSQRAPVGVIVIDTAGKPSEN